MISINDLFLIFIGGGIGSVFRYLTNLFFSKIYFIKLQSVLLGTLTVNIIGSLILGFAFSFFMNKLGIPNNIKLAISVGFCGGLTTFSTFSLETYNLIKNGEILYSIVYVILNVLICVLMIALGLYLGNITSKAF